MVRKSRRKKPRKKRTKRKIRRKIKRVKKGKTRRKKRAKKVKTQKIKIMGEKPKQKIVIKINEMLRSKAIKKDVPNYEPFNKTEKPKLLNSEEMGVVKTALEKPLKNVDKKVELLRNSDISTMKKKSKRNSRLLTPSQLKETLSEMTNSKKKKKGNKKSK